MAEEIDDNGFYREDFSAESDWEILNAQLCDLFQKWELSRNHWGDDFDINKCKWQKEEEQFQVLDKQITVQYYKAALLQHNTENAKVDDKPTPPLHNDLMCLANTSRPPAMLEDKPNEVHYLSRMYGLRRFVVMHPTKLQSHYLKETSEFSFFLSSISVVAAEVCSAVPIFLQIREPKFNFFLGVGMSSYMRTNFDLVALDKSPKEFLYLSGLIKMFKEKIPRHYDQPAVVSVRNTYALDTIDLRIPMYVPFGMTPLVDEERSSISVSQFTALPHGYIPDSNTRMFAVFTWPELLDKTFIDSALQTQFVPSKAPCGSLYQMVHAKSYLTDCLKLYYNLITAKNTLESYVGRSFSGGLTLAEGNTLDQLGKIGTHRKSKQYVAESNPDAAQKKLPGPMKEYELNQMLYYLFPDMQPEMALFPYEMVATNKIDPHRIKSAEADSLVYRLSCLLATCHAHFGAKMGLAQLYASFTRELRLLWDCCIPIPGVAPGIPDTRTCLLHQKLQLLNVCIEKRLQREKGIQPKTETQPQDTIVITDDETDEEEFYDFTDDESQADDEEKSEKETKTKTPPKPEGRLKRLHNLRLLHSEEYLYVPITQDPVPKTEDQLQDDADAVIKMGSDSEFVTDMMCTTVVSDTEAFKAANPNACFADFIRWFSPNDWEEYRDEETGELRHKLSPRMQAEGNTWQNVWEQAKSVPASKQKRLFDDTQEGYKILNYLESRNLGEIFGLTIVPLLHSSVLKLKEIFLNSQVLELFNVYIDEILADLSRFSRDIELVEVQTSGDNVRTSESKYTLQLPNPQAILNKIEQLEKYFYQYKCFELMRGVQRLETKQLHKIFDEIIKNKGNCNVGGGGKHHQDSVGEFSLQSLFQGDMHERLLSKDYVIRMGEGLLPDSTVATSSEKENQLPASTIMPQFLRAIVAGDTLRLCGAFTENITFLD